MYYIYEMFRLRSANVSEKNNFYFIKSANAFFNKDECLNINYEVKRLDDKVIKLFFLSC